MVYASGLWVFREGDSSGFRACRRLYMGPVQGSGAGFEDFRVALMAGKRKVCLSSVCLRAMSNVQEISGTSHQSSSIGLPH